MVLHTVPYLPASVRTLFSKLRDGGSRLLPVTFGDDSRGALGSCLERMGGGADGPQHKGDVRAALRQSGQGRELFSRRGEPRKRDPEARHVLKAAPGAALRGIRVSEMTAARGPRRGQCRCGEGWGEGERRAANHKASDGLPGPAPQQVPRAAGRQQQQQQQQPMRFLADNPSIPSCTLRVRHAGDATAFCGLWHSPAFGHGDAAGP